MTPYGAYKIYIGLKAHFTTKKYDVFKNSVAGIPKTNATEESFEARKDKVIFDRLAYKYGDDVGHCFVSMMITNRSDIWDIGANHQGYLEFKGRRNNLIGTVRDDCAFYYGKSVDDLMRIKGDLPTLFKDWLGGRVSPEFVCLFNKKYPCFDMWAKDHKYDPIWKRAGLVITKYAPFVSPVEKTRNEINNLLERTFE